MSIAEQLKASILTGDGDGRRAKLRAILEFWTDVVDAHYHAHIKGGYSVEEMHAEYKRMREEKMAEIAATNYERGER